MGGSVRPALKHLLPFITAGSSNDASYACYVDLRCQGIILASRHCLWQWPEDCCGLGVQSASRQEACWCWTTGRSCMDALPMKARAAPW